MCQCDRDPLIWSIDDDEGFRQSLRFLFASVGHEVRLWDSGQAFLEALPDLLPLPPAVLVMDIRMPGMSGLELLRHLRARSFVLPILIVTGHGDVQMAVEALKAGADDFIEKPFKEQHLLDVTERALRLAPARLDVLAGQQRLEARLARLSGREREVLEGILEGKPNKVMASDMELSIKTIEVHRAAVMSKMAASSVAGLAHAMASRHRPHPYGCFSAAE
ncbi:MULTISPECIES: response regulator [Thioclava]|uniref:Response regulator n=1 Tax=Thioclava litoralis TaxID=3076557 RepID=A0ABZ1E4S5_9RHOB|nr:response regulator [Thioclava sp. FTW29]